MSTGLRERKKLDTRRALTEAALALAVEHGYHGFTVADLTDGIGVSRRTFSNYFAGRAECVVAICDDWLDEILAVVESCPTGADLDHVLRTALVAFGQRMTEGAQQYFRLLAAEPELQVAAAGLTAVHQERIAAAIARVAAVEPDDLRVRLLAGYALNAGELAVQQWSETGMSGGVPALAELLDTAFSLIDLTALRRR